MRLLVTLGLLFTLVGNEALAWGGGGLGLFMFPGTSSSLGGSALTIGSCSSTTVTVNGATIGMAVAVTPTANPGAGAMWSGWVSSTNTVTVEVCAIVALTPTATTYNVRVLP